MRNVGCQLQVISIGSNQDELQMLKPDSSSSATDSTSVSIAQENHKMIQRIICHVNGEILYLKNPEDIDDTIRACQCKQVRQTTKFRGVLDIGYLYEYILSFFKNDTYSCVYIDLPARFRFGFIHKQNK